MTTDRYRIERRLGSGAMASVHLARDVELDRPVALKRLLETRDEEIRARFLREARLVARVTHPNVVRVYDVGELDGQPFIAMEYVDGGTIADLAKPVAPAEAARLVAQAARGLAAVHAAGLVHRDVKPQNLLLRRDGVVKLGDFGIARGADATRLTMAGTVLGTAAYLAPEQARGEDAGPPADVYGLGAVLYELLTGRTPRTPAALAEVALAEPRPIEPVRDLAPATPPELERLAMRCLAFLPERRPTAAEVAATLSGEPVETPTLVAAPRRTPRRRLLAAAGAVVFAALALGLGVDLSGGGAKERPRVPPAPRVAPVPHRLDPAQQAQQLAAWLRKNS